MTYSSPWNAYRNRLARVGIGTAPVNRQLYVTTARSDSVVKRVADPIHTSILKLKESASKKGISMPDAFWRSLETNPYRSGILINNRDGSTTWRYDPNGSVYDYGSMSIEDLKSLADAYYKDIDLRQVDPRNWIHELSSKPSTKSLYAK